MSLPQILNTSIGRRASHPPHWPLSRQVAFYCEIQALASYSSWWDRSVFWFRFCLAFMPRVRGRGCGCQGQADLVKAVTEKLRPGYFLQGNAAKVAGWTNRDIGITPLN